MPNPREVALSVNRPEGFRPGPDESTVTLAYPTRGSRATERTRRTRPTAPRRRATLKKD